MRSTWELFLKDSVTRGLGSLNGAADKVSNAFGHTQDKINKAQQALSGVANEIPGVSRGMDMLNNSSVLIGAGIMAVGTGLYKATNLAYDYETGMAKINATAQLSQQSLGGLKDRLKEIGSHSGGNFEMIPEAYEKILSQTGKVNQSLNILETAVMGSKAGFASLDLTASALAQTLSVVGEGNATASEVMDTLMKAKGLGGAEFKDFAQYMPQLIASGASLNTYFKDTAGIFSYMTAKGNSAADSAMLMQNAFSALQKNEVMKGLQQKGVELFDVKGMRRNIKDVFVDLSAKLAGLTDKNRTQFLLDIGLNDAQARTAFQNLTSESEKFKTIMDGVNHSLGETQTQLGLTKNAARNWGDVTDELKNWGETFGSTILPVIDELVQGLSFSAAMIKDLFTTGRIHDTDKMSELSISAKRQAAMNAAAQATETTLGINPFDKNAKHTKESSAFYEKRYQDIMSAFAGQKNHIVDEKTSVVKSAFGKESKLADKTGVNAKIQSSIEGVSGGGKSVRNVTVNIGKLVEQLIVKAGTVTESAPELERKVQEYLLRAIQGSEIALSND